MMKKTILALFTAITTLASKSEATLIFSDSVPADQKQALASDLLSLAQSKFINDPVLASLMGIEKTDGLSLANWIDNRVNYIVDENFRLRDNTVVIQPSFSFEKTALPPIEVAKPNPQNPAKLYVLMSNLGASLYVESKRDNNLVGVKVNNQVVQITSPRSGLFQVGNGMFTNAKQIGIGTKNVASARAMRLAVLIHEARHSDGRGEVSGFFHRVCPAGHRLVGTFSCDATSNGPYGVEARFLKDYLKQCKDCTEIDKEYLRKFYLDVSTRLAFKSSNKPGDSNPEGQYGTVSRAQTWSTIYWLGK